MRRKLVIIAVSVVAAALVAVAALPWWLGAALGAAGGRFGLEFDAYRRIGYGRFALEGLRLKTAAVDATVSRVELDTPLAWMSSKRGPVVVDRWSVTATGEGGASADEGSGWVELQETLRTIVDQVSRWVPEASAAAGAVAWEGGRIELGPTVWTRGALRVDALRWREFAADVDARFEGGRLALKATSSELGVVVNATAEGAALRIDGTWQHQPWTASAMFGPAGWMPAEARADAQAWSVLGARLGLGGFYEVVNGDISASWRERAFSVDMRVSGLPVADSEAPPLQVALHGSGAADRLSIDRLELSMPGVVGTLSRPLELIAGGVLTTPGGSRFELAADLAELPWRGGEGRVTGAVDVTPRDGGVPLVEGRLNANGAKFGEWTATKADVEVRVEWPRVAITGAEIELAGGDRVKLGGVWDAAARSLADGKIEAQVSRATAARWLPDDTRFDTITVSAAAAGAWPAVGHMGKIEAKALQIAPMKPVSGEVTWMGKGEAVNSFYVLAEAGVAQLKGGGSADKSSARIAELVLSREGVERLRLAKPASIAWAPALTIGRVELAGEEASIAARLDWTERGSAEMEAANVPSAWIADWIDLGGPQWTLAAFSANGSWADGPLVFSAKSDARVLLDDGRRAELVLEAHGDADGVALDTASATMEDRPVATATGRLPVSIWPWATPRLRVDEGAPLTLDAVTSPHAAFWEQLSHLAGVTLVEPDVNLKLSGTLKKPAGEGRVNLGKIAPGEAAWSRSLPQIENARARLTGDRGGLRLDEFSASISGQTVRASGRLPVKDWAVLLADPLALARVDGEARLEIPDAEVAALARHVPTYLAPAGRLHLDVTLKSGGQLFGVIRLNDAATRPLGPLGILQSIGAEIMLEGRTATLKEVRAMTGGQAVTLTGTAALPEIGEPRLDLALKGSNLPFVRQAGLLVRGDLDLKIKTGDDNVTRITGATRLRDSLFLMDVRAFLPTGGGPRGAPGKRPPYFSVDVAPVNAWALDVAVTGDRFLRLRTPVFTGVASANFRLRGTLGDPRVAGEATVNEGQVLLPFATFSVRQGWVRITERDPFDPRISLLGASRRYGYDLRMEIGGSVERPELTFSSTPALESEQVLLMVMAGEAPQNEVSYTGRERAARLGAYLGQSLLGQLGLDPSSRDRLSVNIGERISRQGRETYAIEYELDPRWSVVGEYDEFDEYNVGLKWRIFPRKRDNGKEAVDEAK